jgi:hypothetical protein
MSTYNEESKDLGITKYNICWIAHETREAILSICYRVVSILYPTAIAINLYNNKIMVPDQISMKNAIGLLEGNPGDLLLLFDKPELYDRSTTGHRSEDTSLPICYYVPQDGENSYRYMIYTHGINICNINIKFGWGGMSIQIEEALPGLLNALAFRLYRHLQIVSCADDLPLEQILEIRNEGRYVINTDPYTIVIASMYATSRDPIPQEFDINDCKIILRKQITELFDIIPDLAAIIIEYIFPLVRPKQKK